MSLNLFIIGASGCGKSTQAKLIAQKYNLSHYSTGQILREEMAKGSLLGNKAKAFIDKGVLVPDDIIVEIVLYHLAKIGNQNFILDGTPRRLDQALIIRKYLQDKGLDISMIIHLRVTFEEIINRRQAKGEQFQDKDRTDNTPEAIQKRQSEYDTNINPILSEYSKLGKLLDVDGNRPVEPIFADISSAIDKLK